MVVLAIVGYFLFWYVVRTPKHSPNALASHSTRYVREWVS